MLVAGKVTDGLTIVVPRINENTLTIVVPPPDATISDIAVSVLRESPLAVRQIELNRRRRRHAQRRPARALLCGGARVVARQAVGRRSKWSTSSKTAMKRGCSCMPTGAIAGRIVADNGGLPPLDGVIVGASWIYDGAEVNPLAVDEAKVAPDGSFRIDNLFGTRKLQLRALELGWEVAAVRQDRTDVTISGVVVVPDSTIEATIVLRRR